MRGQLARLMDEASKAHVSIQVVPLSAGSHTGSEGEFVIIDLPEPEDDPFVYLEGLFGDIYVEAPEDIARYRLAFDHSAADVALSPADSLELARARRRRPAHPPPLPRDRRTRHEYRLTSAGADLLPTTNVIRHAANAIRRVP
jgi:hypothetical protein